MHRRSLLRLAGSAAALGSPAGSALASGQAGDPETCSLPRCVHPRVGYTVFSFDDFASLPQELLPSHQVRLVTRQRDDAPVPDGAEADGSSPSTGRMEPPEAFFQPTGLAVESGDVVVFTPDESTHGVAAYHPQFGRQRRVPPGVTAFSSPLLGPGTLWLYRFDRPGVYDLYSPPAELYGAAMRVVVDGGDPAFGEASAPDRRLPQLTAGLVLDDDALAPDAIAERGTVGWGELATASTQSLVAFRDPLVGLVQRFEGTDTDATESFSLDAGFHVAVFDHDGAGRFEVALVATGGTSRPVILVSDFDTTRGIAGFRADEGQYLLNVDAGGPWSVEIAHPDASADAATGLPATIEGAGPEYGGPFRLGGLVRATASHEGTGRFVVQVYDAEGGRIGGVLFDERGRFQGGTTFSADTVGWLVVDADGAWSITLEPP